ncbi:hypothetical protein QBC46DRAFT_114677 [Diplogelasinospora grovesii]|uniref:Cyanovirin-N domain-containing protein n=1 Tax=Diplogelasinospora grovesii TaxID=303347 RepID=A0AAN6NGD6_9PEZI|nr:hypothetical protein QBC46DRAFT_114677 [Diplogelasinospora grovesii]
MTIGNVLLLATAAILGLLAIGGNSVKNGGLVNSCAYAGANLTGNHWLGIYCLNNDTAIWGYNYTWINLDNCLANNGGQLISYENGSYSGTCSGCAISHDNTTLHLSCLCWDTNNRQQNSSIDLNTTIYDTNGAAGCFSHMGNLTWEDFPAES